MELKNLGNLTRPDERYQNTWQSEPVAVPFLDNLKLRFIVESNGEDIEEINKAVDEFLKLNPDTRSRITPHLYHLYEDFVKSVNDPDLDFTISSESEVWRYITSTEIIIRKRPENNQIYVQVLAECNWDMEHGIQIVFKNGNQLSRVSEQDGHLTHSDAFDVPDSEDRIYNGVNW